MPNSTELDAAFALGAKLNDTCPVTSNGDLYGLGIRIGLYLQIFTAQLSGLASHVLEVDDNIGHTVVVFILGQEPCYSASSYERKSKQSKSSLS